MAAWPCVGWLRGARDAVRSGSKATARAVDVLWMDFEKTAGLPAGWERRVNQAGQVYFVHHDTQRTQWLAPTKGVCACVRVCVCMCVCVCACVRV